MAVLSNFANLYVHVVRGRQHDVPAQRLADMYLHGDSEVGCSELDQYGDPLNNQGSV